MKGGSGLRPHLPSGDVSEFSHGKETYGGSQTYLSKGGGPHGAGGYRWKQGTQHPLSTTVIHTAYSVIGPQLPATIVATHFCWDGADRNRLKVVKLQ